MLPTFASKTLRMQVGNGQFVRVLFTIPLVIDMNTIDLKSLHGIRDTLECGSSIWHKEYI